MLSSDGSNRWQCDNNVNGGVQHIIPIVDIVASVAAIIKLKHVHIGKDVTVAGAGYKLWRSSFDDGSEESCTTTIFPGRAEATSGGVYRISIPVEDDGFLEIDAQYQPMSSLPDSELAQHMISEGPPRNALSNPVAAQGAIVPTVGVLYVCVHVSYSLSLFFT